MIFFEDIPSRYHGAISDIFSYKMGDGPAGYPRMFIARTWLSSYYDETQKTPQPVIWVMNAMRLQEATECSQIIRNIFEGMAEDVADGSIDDSERAAIMDGLRRRIYLLNVAEAEPILDTLSIPIFYDPDFHSGVDLIEVLPFTIETGFDPNHVAMITRQTPISNEN